MLLAKPTAKKIFLSKVALCSDYQEFFGETYRLLIVDKCFTYFMPLISFDTS